MKHLSSYVLLLLLAVLAACNSRQSQEMEAALEQAKAVYGDGSLELEVDTALFIPGLSEASAYFGGKKQYDKAALAALLNGYSEKDFDKEAAMLSFKEAEHYGGLAHDSITQARAEYWIGKFLLETGRTEEALLKLKSANKHAANYDVEESTIENCLAVTYMLLQQFDSAEFYLRNSLVYAQDSHSDELERKTLNNFAVLYRIQGDYAQALNCIRTTLAKPGLDDVEEVLAYLNFGKIFLAEGIMDSAAYYFQRMDSVLQVVDVKEETKVSAYDALLKFAEKQGNDSLALQYYKKHEDALYNVMSQRQEQVVYRIQKQYDYETIRNEMNEKVFVRQRIILVMSLVIVLICLFLVVLKRRLTETRKQEMEAKELTLSYISQYTDLLAKQGKTMQKLAIVMENKEDKALLDNLRATVFDKKDPWNALVEVFDTLHPGEKMRIHQQYPELTEMEFKDIILSYFGVSRQDEALMLKTSVHTIDKIRTSVKKKTLESAEKP